MGIEAPLSKYKKKNLKIYIAFCIVFAVFFAYDGYLSKYQWSHRRSFYEDNVKEGKPNDTMIFNQKAPFFLIAASVFFSVWLWSIKDKKLLADENELVISNNDKIPYNSIEKIDKTHFDSKGFFLITYKNDQGHEINRKFNNRTYDNLTPIVDKLVAKIS